MSNTDKLIVLVHGWSVRSTDTYGALPDRLEAEAAAQTGLGVDVRHIWLGKYVSFRDEVKLEDLSRAFEAAIRRELGAELDRGRRFACITHSTGGPVVRDWWWRHYAAGARRKACPMSHLIMLAPANFGSALAQLATSTISRLKCWFEGVQPGQGVLDWLELGSPESFQLNRAWIESKPPQKGAAPVYFFTLTGQSIDRKLYDHVNHYTGETGSDGVVRAAAANLNASYLRLVQENPRAEGKGSRERWVAPKLIPETASSAPRTAFALLPGLSHSGKDMGILRSIGKSGPHPTVDAILQCLRVRTPVEYEAACDAFDALTASTVQTELVEKVDRLLLPDTLNVHDPCAMLIARFTDDAGHALSDYDFLLLGGEQNSPDLLPQGFFVSRQRNQRHPGTLTYFLNHSVMIGTPDVVWDGRLIRAGSPGAGQLGFRIIPRPQEGFVHFLPGEFAARTEVIDDHLKPHQTLLLDIVLRRVVRQGAFGLTRERRPSDFTEDPPGPPI